MKKNRDTKTISPTDVLIILGPTLQCIYFYQIKLAPLPLLSFIILFFTTNLTGVNIKSIIIGAAFLFLSLCCITVGIIQVGDSIYVPSILGFLIGPLFLIFFLERYSNNIAHLSVALRIVLIIHIFFFIVQYFVFQFTGEYIDYIAPITGEESRIMAVGVLTGQVRCTGLTVEPAGYSIMVCVLVYMRMVITNKLTYIELIGLLTCFMSFSASGMMYALFIVMFYLIFYGTLRDINQKILILTLMTIGLSGVFYFFFDLYQTYYETRFLNLETDTSAQGRFSDAFDYFKLQNFWTQLFGLGAGNLSAAKTQEISTGGSGITSIFTTFGYFFTILFIFVILLLKIIFDYRMVNLALFLVLLLGGIPVTLIFFWMTFASLFLSGIKKNELCAE